jgi:1-acyl-sn-glycerol-3-phosphate acyltransferase
VLYPEGERTNDGNLRIFRKGAAILSIHTHAPIVPIAIEGFYDVWPRHQKFPKTGTLQMTIGKPISPPPESEASEQTYDRLTAKLKSEVETMWQELRQRNAAQEALARSATAHS